MRPGFEKPVYSGCKERIQPGRNLLPLKKTKANPLDRLQACFSRQPIDFWVDKHGKKIYTNLPQENRGMKRCERGVPHFQTVWRQV